VGAYVEVGLQADEPVREGAGIGEHLQELLQVLAVVEDLVAVLAVGKLVDDKAEEAAVEIGSVRLDGDFILAG
jgi:hypothetical protein